MQKFLELVGILEQKERDEKRRIQDEEKAKVQLQEMKQVAAEL